MKKEHLTKSQRVDMKALSTGIIGGAYVLIGDKLGTIYGIVVTGGSKTDPAFIGAIASVAFSILVTAVGFYFLNKANKK